MNQVTYFDSPRFYLAYLRANSLERVNVHNYNFVANLFAFTTGISEIRDNYNAIPASWMADIDKIFRASFYPEK